MARALLAAAFILAFSLGAYADENPGTGVISGAAAGAAGGAAIGGPVGAVIGGAGGAIVGGASADQESALREYVEERRAPADEPREPIAIAPSF
jgi:hypothetical protein